MKVEASVIVVLIVLTIAGTRCAPVEPSEADSAAIRLKRTIGLLNGANSTPDADMPLSYPQTPFNFGGLKQVMLNALFQIAKIVKGGIFVVQGKLVQAKGNLVSSAGKFVSNKGVTLSDLGRNLISNGFSKIIPSAEDPDPWNIPGPVTVPPTKPTHPPAPSKPQSTGHDYHHGGGSANSLPEGVIAGLIVLKPIKPGQQQYVHQHWPQRAPWR